MTSLTDYALNFNKNLKVSFDGGNLSSDTGLLIPRSFDEGLGLSRLIDQRFPKTAKRCHSTADVIRQLMYTTIAGYHTDDASDHLRLDPVFTQILDKKALASQPVRVWLMMRFMPPMGPITARATVSIMTLLIRPEAGTNPAVWFVELNAMPGNCAHDTHLSSQI
ncbi:MAG: transposase [Acetobacterium sp.]